MEKGRAVYLRWRSKLRSLVTLGRKVEGPDKTGVVEGDVGRSRRGPEDDDNGGVSGTGP